MRIYTARHETDKDVLKLYGGNVKTPDLPKWSPKVNKPGKMELEKSDKPMIQYKKFERNTSKGGNDMSKRNEKTDKGVKALRRYGIDERDSQALTFKSENFDSLFLNPYDYGNYSVTSELTQNTGRFAFNIIDFDPIGFSGSVAESNFNIIYNKILNKLAFESNASVTSKFTLDNLKLYIRKVAALVDIFYEVDSILSYAPKQDDNNQVLVFLKALFNDPELLAAKVDLRVMLQTLWLPQDMLKFINWKNQNFKNSSLDQATGIKFVSSRFADAVKTSSLANYKSTIISLLGDLTASADSSTQLSAQTTGIMSAALAKYIDEGGIMNNMPLSCNTNVYDDDFYDVFTNQCSLYGTSGTYPAYNATTTSRMFVTSRHPSNLNTMVIALQGIFNDSSKTGIIRESRYTLSDTVKENKFAILYINGSYSIVSRNILENNISTDLHNVDTSVSPNRKFSIAPAGTQNIYVDAKTVMDVCTRAFQNQLFGF